PRGSILEAVLTSKKVQETGETRPFLKRVYVYYGYIFSHYTPHNPSGFHVNVEFTASLKEQIAGKWLYFTVNSGLDPWRTVEGKARPSGDFKPQNVLGDVRNRGGNEWWYGDQEVVEANKRRYLKKGE